MRKSTNWNPVIVSAKAKTPALTFKEVCSFFRLIRSGDCDGNN
jgi:hypothetical protein